MITEGPLKIGVIDRNNGSRELHLDFTDDFRRMKLSQQCAEAFHEFILYLKCEIGVLEEHDPSHQGMLTILQTSGNRAATNRSWRNSAGRHDRRSA